MYVVDSNNDRIQVFNNGGTFIRTWGSAGSVNGQFNTPFGIAIDSSGNAYVSDIENNRIQKFKKDGTYIRTSGIEGSLMDSSTLHSVLELIPLAMCM